MLKQLKNAGIECVNDGPVILKTYCKKIKDTLFKKEEKR